MPDRLNDWLDAKGRLHRFLEVRDGRAYWRVEIPSSFVRAVPAIIETGGGDSASYYSSTNDAVIVGVGSNYATTQSKSTGDMLDTESITSSLGQWLDEGTYYVYRLAFFFDTSGLPDTCTITQAKVGLYGYGNYSRTDFNMTVVAYSGANPPVLASYGSFGTTSYGALDTSGFVVSGYNEITLNATGIAAINKTGITAFGVRSNRDISATAPAGQEYVIVYMADNTGTSSDPYLSVTYFTNINVWVNIGGVWKQAGPMAEQKVNIGGVWKTVAGMWVNIDGVWKPLA